MKLGIVGLPNVGKSTLFNAITSTKNAEAANYPFCTIEPNSGIVAVPDKRLDKLAEVWQTNKKTPAIVEFVDIAGLVKGASQGAGLGNKFLGHIRECDAIVHVVRCFDDDNIIHVVEDVSKAEAVDPISDIDAIDYELILSDLEVVTEHLFPWNMFSLENRTFSLLFANLICGSRCGTVLTHTVTHTRKCAERAKKHGRGSSASSPVLLSLSAFTSPVP